MIVELLVLIVCLIFYSQYNRRKNLPPGPRALPFIGTVEVFNGKNMRSADFYNYEDMYTIFLGPTTTAIIINDFQRAKDLFFRDEFSGKTKSA